MSDFDRLMGDSLKAIRDDHVRSVEPQIPAARQQIASKMRGRRFTFVIGGLAVAAAAVATFVFISQTVPKIDDAKPIRPAGEPVILNRIDVPGVGVMEAGIDKLWVSHPKGMVGIDPATGSVATESPVGVDDMAADSEAVFAINSNDRSVSRIPFGTDESAISVTMEGTPTVVAASEEAVWVAAATGPEGHSQIVTYTPHLEVPGGSANAVEGSVVADMTYGDDALWMSATRAATGGFEVHRFVEGTGQTWELSESEGSVADIVVGEGAAWVLRQATEGGGNTVTRVGPEAVRDVVERAVSFEDSIESIAVGEGYLWVTTAPLGMNMPDDARSSLHRIDPSTLQPVGEPLEVAGPGSKVEVGYGYVWVGDPNNKQIVQIDPSGQSSPDPEPTTTPNEETSPGPPVDEKECLTHVPFEPGNQAGEWTAGVGSGGQIGIPLRDQNPQSVVYYSDGDRAFVDVTTGEPGFSTEGSAPVEVLGGEGALTGIEDGFAVTFETEGCSYQLLAYGLEEQEVRRFAEGLVPRGGANLSTDAFAMWPETTPEEAYETCFQVDDSFQAFRRDPEETALRFAAVRLRWPDAQIEASSVDYDMEEGYQAIEVERFPTSSGAPRVRMVVRMIAEDCWSVSSVGTVANDSIPRDAPTGLSVSSIDGTTSVGFDLEREAAGHDVASIRLQVGPGSIVLSAKEFEEKGHIELSDEPVNAPTYLLVLLLGPDGGVVGATGHQLPSGDFTAG